MFAGSEEGCGDRKRTLPFKSFDRRTRRDPSVKRNLNHVIRRFGSLRHHLRRRRHRIIRSFRRTGCRDGIFRYLDHFERAGAVRKAPDEPALLQRRDQAVDARLALEVECFLHFLKTWRDAGFFKPLLNEADQLVLFCR